MVDPGLPSQRPVLARGSYQDGQWPERSFRTLPGKAKNAGHVVDSSVLRRGDVLLFADTGFVAWLIKLAQRQRGFDKAHVGWTHAALYVGDDVVLEARPCGGVRTASIYATSFDRTMLVRRRNQTADGSTLLGMEKRYAIVVAAIVQLNRGYSFGLIIPLVWNAVRGRLWRGSSRHVSGVVICSNIVARAYMTGMNLGLSAAFVDVIWPSDLSLCAELDDIRIGWAKVVP